MSCFSLIRVPCTESQNRIRNFINMRDPISRFRGTIRSSSRGDTVWSCGAISVRSRKSAGYGVADANGSHSSNSISCSVCARVLFFVIRVPLHGSVYGLGIYIYIYKKKRRVIKKSSEMFVCRIIMTGKWNDYRRCADRSRLRRRLLRSPRIGRVKKRRSPNRLGAMFNTVVVGRRSVIRWTFGRNSPAGAVAGGPFLVVFGWWKNGRVLSGKFIHLSKDTCRRARSSACGSVRQRKSLPEAAAVAAAWYYNYYRLHDQNNNNKNT